MARTRLMNPFRPGAGHMPPYLAGRESETDEFRRLLRQEVVLENLVLTGLRGVGKTVLLDTFKPIAISADWLWVGTDLSESTATTEERMALRLMTDLAVVTSPVVLESKIVAGFGFQPPITTVERRLTFDVMADVFQRTPGLVADKLRALLEFVWRCLARHKARGVVFAYDEAQTLSDHPHRQQYPLSLMLDVFQSLQKRDIPYLLVLTGLPTLYPKLVESRTFAERMFHVVFLDRLNRAASHDAIVKPMQKPNCPVRLTKKTIEKITEVSGGYPYFIQFVCREVFDAYLQRLDVGAASLLPPMAEIVRKLDNDFFAGRWTRATDRQRELLMVAAHLKDCDREFTVQDVAQKSKDLLEKPFSPSQVSQTFAKLIDVGLIYKNRHGRYAFAVPLLGGFIQRQTKAPENRFRS